MKYFLIFYVVVLVTNIFLNILQVLFSSFDKETENIINKNYERKQKRKIKKLMKNVLVKYIEKNSNNNNNKLAVLMISLPLRFVVAAKQRPIKQFQMRSRTSPLKSNKLSLTV